MTNSNEQLVPVEQIDRDLRCAIFSYIITRLGEPCSDGDMPDDRTEELDRIIASHRLAALRTPPAVEPGEGLVEKACEAFYSKTLVRRTGTIENIAEGLIAACAILTPSIRAQALEDDLKPVGYISWLAGLQLDATDPEAITATDITDFDREAGFMSTPIYVKRSALTSIRGEASDDEQ